MTCIRLTKHTNNKFNMNTCNEQSFKVLNEKSLKNLKPLAS